VTTWLLGLWLHIAQQIVAWTTDNNPDRDRAYVDRRIDELTAKRQETR
jgi:hypothetical protein